MYCESFLFRTVLGNSSFHPAKSECPLQKRWYEMCVFLGLSWNVYFYTFYATSSIVLIPYSAQSENVKSYMWINYIQQSRCLLENGNTVCFKDLNISLIFLNAKKNLAHSLLLLRHSTYHDDLIKSLLQLHCVMHISYQI